MNLACKDSDAIYLSVEEERDFRTPFFRDIVYLFKGIWIRHRFFLLKIMII